MPSPQSNFKKAWVFLELTFSSTSELLNHSFLALIRYIHNCSAWGGDISRNGSSAWQRTQHCWEDKSKVTRPCSCQRTGTPQYIVARWNWVQVLESWWRLKSTNIANDVTWFLWYALPGINTKAVTEAFKLAERQPELQLRRTQWTGREGRWGRGEGKMVWHKPGRRELLMDRKNKLSPLSKELWNGENAYWHKHSHFIMMVIKNI